MQLHDTALRHGLHTRHRWAFYHKESCRVKQERTPSAPEYRGGDRICHDDHVPFLHRGLRRKAEGAFLSCMDGLSYPSKRIQYKWAIHHYHSTEVGPECVGQESRSSLSMESGNRREEAIEQKHREAARLHHEIWIFGQTGTEAYQGQTERGVYQSQMPGTGAY